MIHDESELGLIPIRSELVALRRIHFKALPIYMPWKSAPEKYNDSKIAAAA